MSLGLFNKPTIKSQKRTVIGSYIMTLSYSGLTLTIRRSKQASELCDTSKALHLSPQAARQNDDAFTSIRATLRSPFWVALVRWRAALG
jgi:hypothetical protein